MGQSQEPRRSPPLMFCHALIATPVEYPLRQCWNQLMFEFEKAACEKFDALAAAAGLKVASSHSSALRYESDSVFLQIFFDHKKTSVLIVEIGQKATAELQTERPFGLIEIMNMRGSPEVNYISGFRPMSQESLVQALEHLSKHTNEFAGKLLRNDASEFQALAAYRKNECTNRANPKNIRAARAEAKTALLSEDHFGFIKALRSIEVVLTSGERLSLVLAEKKILWG